MLGEELMKRIDEAEEKARKWDLFSKKYKDAGELLKQAIADLDSAREKFVRVTNMIDPIAQVSSTRKPRVSNISKYFGEQKLLLESGQDITVESMTLAYPDLSADTIKYIFSTKLGKLDGVVKRSENHKKILSMKRGG